MGDLKTVRTKTNEKYCVLDFDEFWEGCMPKEEIVAQPWDEIRPMKQIYDKIFPKKRIDTGLQRTFLDEVKLRLKSGLSWSRSSNLNVRPILFLYGTASESFVIPKNIIKILDKKLITLDRMLTGYFKTGDVGFDNNGIYVSLDGIKNDYFESYYYANQIDLLQHLKRIQQIRLFKIENWCNVMISRGRRGFSNEAQYQMFFRMVNPLPNTPSLFGITGAPEFFAALQGTKPTPIQFIDSEYYYATLKFSIPPNVENIDTVGLDKYTTLIALVNRDFINKTKDGKDVTVTYFDIVSVLGTDTKGLNATGCRIILCLALILHSTPTILNLQACMPAALNVQYHKCCFDMYENRHKSIWIAAGKGAGKSKILTLLKEKGFIVIDSDVYGRVLYQMAINNDNKNIGCPYTEKSNPLEFALWIWNFINSSEFDTAPSFHEMLATEFCDKRSIKLDLLLQDKINYSEYRDFSYNLSKVTNGLIKFQNFANLIGYIPSIVVGMKVDVVPTMVVFCHNTLELFPAMSNAIWKMEPSFETLTAVISRKRQSDVLSQLFLAIYYIKMEPLIANAVPTFILVRALNSLPPYIKSRSA